MRHASPVVVRRGFSRSSPVTAPREEVATVGRRHGSDHGLSTHPEHRLGQRNRRRRGKSPTLRIPNLRVVNLNVLSNLSCWSAPDRQHLSHETFLGLCVHYLRYFIILPAFLFVSNVKTFLFISNFHWYRTSSHSNVHIRRCAQL